MNLDTRRKEAETNTTKPATREASFQETRQEGCMEETKNSLLIGNTSTLTTRQLEMIPTPIQQARRRDTRQTPTKEKTNTAIQPMAEGRASSHTATLAEARVIHSSSRHRLMQRKLRKLSRWFREWIDGKKTGSKTPPSPVSRLLQGARVQGGIRSRTRPLSSVLQ